MCGLATTSYCVTVDEITAAEPTKPAECGVRPKKYKQATAAQGLEWMKRLAAKGGLEDSPAPSLSQFIPAKGEKEISMNPRLGEAYKRKCTDACGLTPEADPVKYGHLYPDEIKLLKIVVRRATGCMWLPDTPRTKMRGMLHDLLTRDGPPIRSAPMRLSQSDVETLENALKEDEE